MESVSAVMLPVTAPQKVVQRPVFIEFTDDYKEKNGIDNNIDKFPPNILLRSPDQDCFGQPQQLCAVKMPNPAEVVKGLALIPIVLETGKQIIIGIFDLHDAWKEKTGKKGDNSECNLKAVVLPDEVTEELPDHKLDMAA